MKSRAITITTLTFAVLAAVAASWTMAGPRPPAGDPGTAVASAVPVVMTAELIWADPPDRLGLAGGWTVELAEPSQLVQQLAVEAATGGRPMLRVVGLHQPGADGRVIRAGGVELARPSAAAAGTVRTGREVGGDVSVRSPAVIARSGALKDDTTLEGPLVAFTGDGFTMDADGTTYRVVVTGDTELEGFDSLDELEIGDLVEARGQLDGTTLTASRVRLRSHDEETTLRGSITTFTSTGFLMDVAAAAYEVVVTPDTVFDNFSSLSDLEVGDEVDATGLLVGSVLTATEIELRTGDSSGNGVDFEYKGRLVRMLPPDRFAMDDGRVYRVDTATVFDPAIGSYVGLAPGQYLEVYAVREPGGDNLVIEIEYEGDSQGGQGYFEISGIVASVGAASIELDTGDVVTILPSTLFTGDADSLSDVVPGWRAEIYAQLELNGDVTAREVRAENPAPATVGGQEFEPQQALVVPAPGAGGDAIAARFGAEVAGRVGDLAVLLWWPEPIDDDLLAALTADTEVAAVEPNYLFRDPESVRRRYPTVDRQASTLKLIDQPAVHRVRMPEAHAVADGHGIVVAVIDTGVDPLHPVLRRRLLGGGLDLVDGDLTPWEVRDGVDGDGDGDVDEASGHGTFVASLIAVAAPRASILPYRVLDDDGGGTAYDLALALADAIQRRVDIINLSLVYQERSTAVDLLLESAAAQGIVVVTSAGNDALQSVPFPASDSHTVAVAALAADGQGLAGFSNRSNLVGLAAPGEEVYGGLDEQSFGSSSGTSMATPFVSATVALLLSADPGLDPLLVRNALLQAGVPVQDGGWTGVALDMAATVSAVAGP